MNLAACRSARRREDFVMRLGCFLVTFAVLASLVLEPPRAKAFAMTSSAVTALAGAYLNACGLAPVVSGMSNSQEVNESLARLIQDYLDMELPGTPLTDWLGNLGNLSLIHDRQWMLLLPTQAAASLHLFAAWVAGKYGTKPGMNVIYSSEGQLSLYAEGTLNNKSGVADTFLNYPQGITIVPRSLNFAYGSNGICRFTVYLEPGIYDFGFASVSEDGRYFVLTSYVNLSNLGEIVILDTNTGCQLDASNISTDKFNLTLFFVPCVSTQYTSSSLTLPIDTTKCWIKRVDVAESSFGLDVSDTMQEVQIGRAHV